MQRTNGGKLLVRRALALALTLFAAISIAGCSQDSAGDGSAAVRQGVKAFIGVWNGVWVDNDYDDGDYGDYGDDFEVFEIIFFSDGTFITNEEADYQGPGSGTYSTANDLLKLSDGWSQIYLYRLMGDTLTLHYLDQSIVLTKINASDSLILNS